VSRIHSKFLKLNNGSAPFTNHDIGPTSFTGNEGQTDANVTGLAFTSDVRGFRALLTVTIDATTDLFQTLELIGIRKGSTWSIASLGAVGDVIDVSFNITNGGQVTYTSSTYSGFTSLTLKFRAEALLA
jgi:hypothetical protein